MKLIGILVLGLVSFQLQAQDSSAIVVHKDPRLDSLVQRHIASNEYNLRHTKRYVQGYRIQVISTRDREKAIETKTLMFREFPKLKSYLIYQSPNYRLKVGNFTEREEADAYLSEMQKVLTSPAYVVHDVIEISGDRLLDEEE
jgi:hypothetical protein